MNVFKSFKILSFPSLVISSSSQPMHLQDLEKCTSKAYCTYFLFLFFPCILIILVFYFYFISFLINFAQARGFTERNGEAGAEDSSAVRARMESYWSPAKSRMGALHDS